MDAKEEPLTCHDIIDEIECTVLEQLQVNLVIHYDPVVVDDIQWTHLRTMVETIVQERYPEFSMHDFRVVQGAQKTKLVFDLAVPYSMINRHKEIKQSIDNALIEQAGTYTTVIRFDGI